MKRNTFLLLAIIVLFNYSGTAKSNPIPNPPKALSTYSLTVFDEILFYDGYNGTVMLQNPPPGVICHRNDLYAKKLTDEQLASFGSTLSMNVTVKASCDNYDRIGNVNIALVPKGSATYVPANVQRIELARFITPFMNKNISPTQVPYSYSLPNVAKMFKDPAIISVYDIWVELEIFGVPYAANTQVAGCANRSDVFFGTLQFTSDTTYPADPDNYLLPLNFKKDLNNYTVGATDVIGQTVRTINLNLPAPVYGAELYLITSNHGSNSGGEEYNRRFHYVYFDNSLKLTYKPGSLTCEPFRVYNTQGNGIYGPTPMTPAQWQFFSNWCPGDVIPIRIIPLGNLAAGNHTFKISVPNAVFAQQQGYIPVSLYLQGRLIEFSLGVDELSKNEFTVFPNPTANLIKVQSEQQIKQIQVFNLLGQQILKVDKDSVDLSNVSKGTYMIQVEFSNGKTASQKIIRE